MKFEFIRFQLTQIQRQLTGILQIIGGLALLLGFAMPLSGMLAAAGLAVQMLLGFLVRLKINDGFWQSLPSFLFMLLNGYLFIYFLNLYL